MRTTTIALVSLLLAAPAAGQDAVAPGDLISIEELAAARTLAGSVADLRALRAASDGPVVRLNGMTCFVWRAASYAPSCWPSRPEWKNPIKTRTAMVIAVVSASAFIGAGWIVGVMAPAAGATAGTAGSGAAIGAITSGAILAATEPPDALVEQAGRRYQSVATLATISW